MSIRVFVTALFVTLAAALTCRAQDDTDIPYGDNPAVGRYYAIRGIKLYVETYGRGRPLLMLHGNGGSMSAFAKNVPYFSKRYKVILVDSRAQGKSIDPSPTLTFEEMADDFDALLQAMHIPRAFVLGWSDGGINALELAMRHPKRVVKLASSGANLSPDSSALDPSEWKDMVKQYNQQKNIKWKTAEEKNDWKIFLLDYQQPHIPVSALRRIKCPSLIICGDDDLIPVEHAALIYHHIPRAYLWVLPNSSHATLQLHTDDFNKKVDQFFSGKGF